MASLYKLTTQMLEFMSFAEDEDLDEQAVMDTLEGMEGELDEKIEAYCKIIKNLEAEAEAVKKEAKRLSDKKKVIDNNITRLKTGIKAALDAMNRKEAGGLLKAKICTNGGDLPLVVTEQDATALPAQFQKVEISANNEAIRKALKDGEDLPFAHFGERGQYIRIG